MANIPIRDITISGTPAGNAYVVFDDGQMKKALVSDLAEGVRPLASQSEAQVGTDNVKAMSALRTKESIAAEVGDTIQAQNSVLTSLGGLNSVSGLIAQTVSDTFVQRTLTGTANEVTVTNGTGSAGNPTISLPTAITMSGKVATGGEYVGPTLTGPDINGGTIDGATFDGVSLNFGVGGSVAYLGNSLGSFATTTSAALAGVISDETGSGALVFANAPTLVNPVVGTQSPGDNTTKAASTAFVQAAVTGGASGVASIAGNTGAFTLSRGLTNATNALLVDPVYMRGYIAGLTTSNNAVTPNTKIDVSSGLATDDTRAIVMNYAGGTLDLTTVGALGLDAGSLANNTWYHMFVIAQTGGTVSLLASTSPTSPAFPSGYTLKRRIGSFLTNGSAQVIAYTQIGNDFFWAVQANDYNGNNPGTSAIVTALTLPPDVVVRAKITYYLQSGEAARRAVLVSSMAQPDTAPGAGTLCSVAAGLAGEGGSITQTELNIWTNTSRQIRHRFDGSSAATAAFINTVGWYDPL